LLEFKSKQKRKPKLQLLPAGNMAKAGAFA
jgi:hypothetical protein